MEFIDRATLYDASVADRCISMKDGEEECEMEIYRELSLCASLTPAPPKSLANFVFVWKKRFPFSLFARFRERQWVAMALSADFLSPVSGSVGGVGFCVEKGTGGRFGWVLNLRFICFNCISWPTLPVIRRYCHSAAEPPRPRVTGWQ